MSAQTNPNGQNNVQPGGASLTGNIEQFPSLSDLPTLVIHGRRIAFVRKAKLAGYLGISVDTVDAWVSRGYLPPPIDPDQRSGPGRKVLLWDVYECVERISGLRRCA